MDVLPKFPIDITNKIIEETNKVKGKKYEYTLAATPKKYLGSNNIGGIFVSDLTLDQYREKENRAKNGETILQGHTHPNFVTKENKILVPPHKLTTGDINIGVNYENTYTYSVGTSGKGELMYSPQFEKKELKELNREWEAIAPGKTVKYPDGINKGRISEIMNATYENWGSRALCNQKEPTGEEMKFIYNKLLPLTDYSEKVRKVLQKYGVKFFNFDLTKKDKCLSRLLSVVA